MGTFTSEIARSQCPFIPCLYSPGGSTHRVSARAVFRDAPHRIGLASRTLSWTPRGRGRSQGGAGSAASMRQKQAGPPHPQSFRYRRRRDACGVVSVPGRGGHRGRGPGAGAAWPAAPSAVGEVAARCVRARAPLHAASPLSGREFAPSRVKDTNESESLLSCHSHLEAKSGKVFLFTTQDDKWGHRREKLILEELEILLRRSGTKARCVNVPK